MAYPISAIAGYWFASTSVRDSTYDNLKRYGAFDDIRAPHHTKIQETVTAAAQQVAKNETVTVNITKEIAPLHREFIQEISQRLEKLKLGEAYSQFKFLHKTQKQQAFRTGMAAFGITLGTLLAVANSKTLNYVFSRHGGSSKDSDSPAR